MPDASGLDQQQAIAAKIPYENIALGNPVDRFLNAWQISSRIKEQRQAVEGKLMALQMHNQQLENNAELNQAKFGLSVMSEQQRAQHAQDTLGLAVQGMGLKQAAFDLNTQKYQDKIEGTTSVLNAEAKLAEQGIMPGDPRYPAELLKEHADMAGKAPTSLLNSVQRTAFLNHNSAIQQQERANNAKMNQLGEDVGREIFGNKNKQDLRPILNYETLPDETTGGGIFPWSDTAKKTGNKLVPGATEPVSSQKLAEFNSRYKQIVDERNKLAMPVTAPSLGVYPAAQRSVPSQTDIEYLRSHPEKASKFEAKFGTGSSSQFLQ